MCYGSIDNTCSAETSHILNHIPKMENKIFFENKFHSRLDISDSEYNIFRLKIRYFIVYLNLFT